MSKQGANLPEVRKKTQFSSENQPENRGRKPRLYTIFKGNEPLLSKEEYKRNCLALLISTPEEFKRIASDAEAPMYIKVVANAIKEDIATGKATMMQQIIEDNFGKTEQKISADISFGDFLKKASVLYELKDDDREGDL